jgi:hypothetical protein
MMRYVGGPFLLMTFNVVAVAVLVVVAVAAAQRRPLNAPARILLALASIEFVLASLEGLYFSPLIASAVFLVVPYRGNGMTVGGVYLSHPQLVMIPATLTTLIAWPVAAGLLVGMGWLLFRRFGVVD